MISEVLHELMRHLPEESLRNTRGCATALKVRAAASLRDFSEEEAGEARAVLAPELAMRGGTPALTIMATGHAHMDLAWLGRSARRSENRAALTPPCCI